MFQQFVEIHPMKKFTLKAITLATASVCGSAAFAGTITAPVVVNYAIEALAAPPAAATPIAGIPNIVYTMGVSRTAAQDFTIIYKPTSGSTFGACPIAPAAFTIGGTGAATVSNKRSSATECAYEVDVTTATDTTTTVSIAGLTFATHNLAAAAGNTAGVTVGLFDLGETARIDNNTDLTATVAQSGNALTLTATADTGTTTDVNDEFGPLFGFVSQNDDGNATATASFSVGNNATGAFVMPDGTTQWNFASHGTSINVTVAGNYQGLLANGYLVNGFCGADPTATVAGGNATFSLLPANFTCGVGTYGVENTFTSARNASLGTSRVFGVSAVGDVVTGANRNLSGNASWWTWDANASQLMTPFFNNNPNYITRFFFLNTSAANVSYSVQCFTEGGGAVTNGAGGTLAANATTNVVASSVCTFPASAPRGAVIFTINAPIQAVKGTFQQIAPTGADGVVTPLVRPYTTAATTE
jgi:hypothetical protein